MRYLLLICVFALCMGLNGCPFPWPEPGPGPGPGPGPEPEPETSRFTIEVVPEAMNDTIPGQRCVLLVKVENEDPADSNSDPVQITAEVPENYVTVEPEMVNPGKVAEIAVIPQPYQGEFPEEGVDLTVSIRAERDEQVETAEATIHVTSQEEDLVGPTAAEVRDLFIPWLEANHPELGITADTEWTGTIVTLHILVVTHYLYFSDDWEMHVYWHVMIPPDDWAKIELRRRFEETLPSLAFEIPSRSAEPPLEAQPIDLPDTLWR